MREQTRYRRLALLHKHAAWLYAVFYAVTMLIFIKLSLYRLPFRPEQSYQEKYKIPQYGLVRLRGNLGHFTSWSVLLLLAAGILLGLAIFFISGRQLHQPRWPAIVLIVGALVPLLPPYTENILTRLAVGSGLIAFAAFFQWFLNQQLFVRESPYRRQTSYFDQK